MMTLSSMQQRLLDHDESKSIARQLVDIEILYLLNFGPKSGYDLKKHLQSSFGINVSYGTLYPHLYSLEKSKFITGTWAQKDESTPLKKRMYSLTSEGALTLRSSVGSLAKITLTMQFMLTKVNLNSAITPLKADRENALGAIENFLSAQGYSVKKSAVLKGFSGSEHQVELYATKPETLKTKAEKLIVKTASSDSGASIDDVMKMYVMSYDVQATQAVMLTVPAAQEEILKVAEFYRISVYDGANWVQAVENMNARFNGN